jgi:tetratricopeptide (TPR) repeat protein
MQSVPTTEPERSLRLGADQEQLGNYQAAIGHYTQAIQLQPQDARAYVARATVQTRLKNWQAAIADLTQAIAHDPNNADLYWQRGRLYEEVAQDQQAVADYERVLQLDTPRFGMVVFQPLFKQYLQQGNQSQAIALVDRVLNQLFSDTDPPELRQLSLATRHLMVGMIQIFFEDHPEAVRSLTQAIALAPQNTWAYYLRGSAFEQLGNEQQAQQDYRQVLKIAPEQALPKEIYRQSQTGNLQPVPAAHLASIYYVRGAAHFRLNDPQSAIADLNQSIKLNPNYALAYRDRGLVLQQLGKQAAGMEDLRTAAQLFKQQRNAIGYGFVLEILLEDFPTTER